MRFIFISKKIYDKDYRHSKSNLDSFSDGGMYYDINSAKKHVADMISQGADVIDLGAESTRSGFSDVDEDIQIKTLSPIVDFIANNYEIPISIDTDQVE